MANKAVIIIDMLNQYVTADLKTKRATRIIPNLKKLIKTARKHGVPVIYSNDACYKHEKVIFEGNSPAIKGTSGAQVISELAPREEDFIVEKRFYSGFYETGIDPLLRSLNAGKGVDTVILGGRHTHICIRHTAADAFFRGYKIVIASDGVEAQFCKISQNDHEEGLKYIKELYGAEIKTVDEIVEDFKKK